MCVEALSFRIHKRNVHLKASTTWWGMKPPWHALVHSWAYSYGAMGSRNAKTQIRYECTGDRSHLECPTS